MSRPRVLVVVLAGGAGSRLGPLTDHRAKPSVAFGGQFRLIDVTLSNVAHSGLDDVWVLVQYEPHALTDHLAGGRPWDLDRTHGGLRVLPPFQASGHDDGDAAVAHGNADALVQQRAALRSHGADIIVTMSADHVYRLDLREVIEAHIDQGSMLTAVTTRPHPDDDPTRFSWVRTDDDGTIVDFAYKPAHPDGERVCTEVFVFDGPRLLEALEDLDGGEPAGDYGDALVPGFVDAGVAAEYVLDGYWRDVGTVAAFHRAHLELVADDPPFDLDDRSWPMLTGSITGGPARIGATADVQRAILAPGAVVDGSVLESVVGRHAVIEPGARVARCVILDDAVIRTGVDIHDAIVNAGVVVGRRSTPISGDDADPDVAVFDGPERPAARRPGRTISRS